MNGGPEKKPTTWNNKNILFPIILILLSTCFFYYINSSIEEFQNWPTLKYKSGDSTSYLNSGKWFLNQAPLSKVESSVAIRPFFYSVTVAGLEKVHPQAIQAYQFSLWIAQIVIVYFCGLLISRSSPASFLLSLTCVVILSPVGITLHALSETTASFLLVFSFFFLILYLKKGQRNRFIFLHLLMLSFCSVTKPLYFYVFIISLVICFIIIGKGRKKIFISSCFALITLVPILYQISIMKSNFDLAKISCIDSIVLNDYFLVQFSHLEFDSLGKRKQKGIRYDIYYHIQQEGYKKTDAEVKKRLLKLIYSNPKEILYTFFDIILVNSSKYSFFLSSRDKSKEILYQKATTAQNLFLRSMNIFSLLIVLLFFIARRINDLFVSNNYIVINIFSIAVIFLTYMSTGITFWQGDRFMIPIYFFSLIWFFFQLDTIFVFFRKKV